MANRSAHDSLPSTVLFTVGKRLRREQRRRLRRRWVCCPISDPTSPVERRA